MYSLTERSLRDRGGCSAFLHSFAKCLTFSFGVCVVLQQIKLMTGSPAVIVATSVLLRLPFLHVVMLNFFYFLTIITRYMSAYFSQSEACRALCPSGALGILYTQVYQHFRWEGTTPSLDPSSQSSELGCICMWPLLAFFPLMCGIQLLMSAEAYRQEYNQRRMYLLDSQVPVEPFWNFRIRSSSNAR